MDEEREIAKVFLMSDGTLEIRSVDETALNCGFLEELAFQFRIWLANVYERLCT